MISKVPNLPLISCLSTRHQFLGSVQCWQERKLGLSCTIPYIVGYLHFSIIWAGSVEQELLTISCISAQVDLRRTSWQLMESGDAVRARSVVSNLRVLPYSLRRHFINQYAGVLASLHFDHQIGKSDNYGDQLASGRKRIDKNKSPQTAADCQYFLGRSRPIALRNSSTRRNRLKFAAFSETRAALPYFTSLLVHFSLKVSYQQHIL